MSAWVGMALWKDVPCSRGNTAGWDWSFSRDGLLFIGNAVWAQMLLPDSSVCMGTEKTEDLNLLLLFWPLKLVIHTHPHSPQSAFFSWLTHLTKHSVTLITLNPSCGYGCWREFRKMQNLVPQPVRILRQQETFLVTCKYQICFLETCDCPL